MIVLGIEDHALGSCALSQFIADGTRAAPNSLQLNSLGRPATSSLQDRPDVARRLNPGQMSEAGGA
jgi:hypothetical protein